jgi:hypothetical protein
LEFPELDPAAAAAEAMRLYDGNGDSVLDAAELRAAPGLRAALPTADADKNGSLTLQELAARLEKYNAEGLALMPFSCELLLDGRPLADADVRLIPEAFLGPQIKPAVGRSGPSGVAALNAEGLEGFTGVYFGMYRMEISKKNESGQETLPAKLNSQTTLGQEVAADRPELDHAVRVELTSR